MLVTRPLDTLGARLRFARRKRSLSQDDLASAAGESQPTVSKIERGEIQQPTSIARLAAALRVPPLWLELGHGPEPDWMHEQHTSEGRLTERVAQYVIQPQFEDAPHIELGANMNSELLPTVFWTPMPDDAMAPRVPPGKLICFDKRLEPRAGDGVLVVDGAGQLAVRLYRVAPLGRWTAHAMNPAYEPMDSQQHGLRVVAVLKAEEGRWA